MKAKLSEYRTTNLKVKCVYNDNKEKNKAREEEKDNLMKLDFYYLYGVGGWLKKIFIF